MKYKNRLLLNVFLFVLVFVSLSSTAFANEFNSKFSNKNYQSIFYVNDLHGQLAPMNKINNAELQFEAFVSKNKNIDAFKFSAGDIFIGSNEGVNKASAAFLNVSNIEVTAIGNHEFDMGATKLSEILEDVKAIKVAANADIPKDNPLYSQVVKSYIMTSKSGHKYGVLGAQSPTLVDRMKDKSLFEGIKISGGNVEYSQIQKEVNKLQKEGINRIIMLSHSGYEEEKELAKNISGVDVIIGGHSHDLIFDIKEGENLQYSPKGEPVIITQAGRDGKNFGILNVEYDDNGVVIKAQNNVYNTNIFAKSILMTTTTNVILGQSPVIAKIESVETLTDRMNVEENPYVDIFLDMVKKETGADIALVNSSNFRGSLDVGNVTERDISGIFPFKNSMCVVELSEKNLIGALNHGGKSLLAPDLKPSIIQVAGMTYTLDKNGKVIKASVLNKDGSYSEIDVNNPSEIKTYKVAYDDYLLSGGDGFISLKDARLIKKYDYDKDVVVINYLRKNKQTTPLVIKRDNRIKFE